MMYNRYIPQSDGTYLRKRFPEPSPLPSPQSPPPAPPQLPPEPVRPVPPPCERENSKPPQKAPKPPTHGLSGFWENLLPKGFDTGDLIVLLLLLLMAADCHDEQNTALLTLALYLFL